ncbi:MAG: hypothetical protein QOH08_2374 [Chloroflexota bacterium]|jgi:AcrR family transcriptional regulator|nr:hypothetical protein [Chloroflexota bacterium]
MPNPNSPSPRDRKLAVPQRRDARESLERLLTGAEAAFAERGYHAASIHEICGRAKVGIGTFYAHFEDKNELIASVMTERAIPLMRAITADELFEPDALVRRLRLHLDDPQAVGLWTAWREAMSSDATLRRLDGKLQQELIAALAPVVQEARDRAGAASAPSLEPILAAWSILAALRLFLARDRTAAPSLADAARVVRYLALGPDRIAS